MLDKRKVITITIWAVALVCAIPGCGEKKTADNHTEHTSRQQTQLDKKSNVPDESKYVGSKACRRCHEKFYQLWDTSHHGKAMQPFTKEFAASSVSFDGSEIQIGKHIYSASFDGEKGYVIERRVNQGASTSKRFEILHVLGGKNVFYFLTPLEKGRLQTLPIGYDVHKKAWFDVAQSGVRHFANIENGAVNWRDLQYTFNTSCYSCHVSQLAQNYDAATDTYSTHWREPGINCETCHGASRAHIDACDNAPPGTVPKDLKITGGKGKFSAQQNNDTCASCHAKMIALSDNFMPGDDFFNHFDLVLFEHPDYYPDGRDLGENYTFTSWRMSPCSVQGKLDCLHCHTPSGRFRQKNAPETACAPCHNEKNENMATHSRHTTTEHSPNCVDCHMPMTRFANMNRSDHSMLPPSPAGSVEFGSPNACNLCHTDRTAEWAAKQIVSWHGTEHSDTIIHRGRLVHAANRREWKQLDDMLTYVGDAASEEITVASLLRLLARCPEEKIPPALLPLLAHSSALVRSSAIQALSPHIGREITKALIDATMDKTALVRIRAAEALSQRTDSHRLESQNKSVKAAMNEYVASMTTRPDDYASHYNLGNFYVARGDFAQGIESYQRAIRLHSDAFSVWVNLAMAQYQHGDISDAKGSFEKALALEPNNEVANLNMAMYLAEMGDTDGARRHFEIALKANPESASAAYNLCVIDAAQNWKRAMPMCRLATMLIPEESKYGYAFAFYLYEHGNATAAKRFLENAVMKQPTHAGMYILLAKIYHDQGNPANEKTVYQAAINNDKLPPQERATFNKRLQQLNNIRP